MEQQNFSNSLPLQSSHTANCCPGKSDFGLQTIDLLKD